MILVGQTSDEPAPSVVSETPKKHVPAWLRFVLVVVLLLLSALVLLWIPPSPSPLSPSPIPPPTPHTNGSLAIDIPDPQKVPEDATEIDGNLIPHGPGVVEDDKPIWPSPSTIVNKGGLVHFYWVKYLPSSRVLYVISLLLLAVLALFWPSMTRTKGTEPEGKADLPSETQKKLAKSKILRLNQVLPTFLLLLYDSLTVSMTLISSFVIFYFYFFETQLFLCYVH